MITLTRLEEIQNMVSSPKTQIGYAIEGPDPGGMLGGGPQYLTQGNGYRGYSPNFLSNPDIVFWDDLDTLQRSEDWKKVVGRRGYLIVSYERPRKKIDVTEAEILELVTIVIGDIKRGLE